ncbi:MAG: YcaO-like family protein [Pseudonocardiaceae bacterium]
MTAPTKSVATRTRRWRGIPEGDGPPWTDPAVAERLFGQFRSDLVGIVTGVNQRLRDVDDVRAFTVGASTCETTHLLGERSTATNGGGALHERAAVVAAIAETVERYSATYRPDDAVIQASWRELAAGGDNAVSPGQLRLFTDAQLCEPGFPFVGFTDDLTIRWVPGVGLASGQRTWLPASLVFLSAPPREPAGCIGYSTSNGLAAGCTWDEAALAGLLELVERDGFCTTWHNGLSMPRIDPASDPEVSAFFDRHVRPAGLSVALVDLSRFGQVPSVLAIVRNENNDIAPIGLGAAAAADPRRAITKAVIEAFQTRVWMRAEQRAGTALPPDTDFTAEIRDFPDHVRLYSGPGLIEHTRFLDASDDRVAVGDLPAVPGARPRQVLLGVLEHLAAQGVDVYLADATSPDVRSAGAVVARVFAPALVPLDAWYRARFLGVPRLRRRPVELGLVPRPRRDEELTAYPHPFP